MKLRRWRLQQSQKAEVKMTKQNRAGSEPIVADMIVGDGQHNLSLLSHRDEKGLRGLRTWLPLRMWIEKPGGG